MTLNWSQDVEELVRKFARTWGLRLGFGREDIEDFEQEAVCMAFVKISDGKIAGSHGLWAIVRNFAFDFRRRLSTEVSVVEIDEDLISYTIDRVVFSRLELVEIEHSHPELVAYAEARAAGYSWDDIGSAFGLSSSTLRVRWMRMCRDVCDKMFADVSHNDKYNRL